MFLFALLILIGLWFKPTIYHTRGEHSDHYITNAVYSEGNYEAVAKLPNEDDEYSKESLNSNGL
jgi:hypothetical protein